MSEPRDPLKACSRCGATKPLDEYPRNKCTRDGRAVYCKPCHTARGRETRERLCGRGRHNHVKRRYGIGADAVDAMADHARARELVRT